jgi:DNA-binding transcriptional regulator YhcF (GntR family)
MEFREQRPIYLQIGDHICENILRGRWKGGDRIPSVREMAVSIEVNPNTVMRTYSHLQDLGIIYNRRGIGYFVSDRAYDLTRQLRRRTFIDRDLPRLFRTMDLLGVTPDEVGKLYAERTNSNGPRGSDTSETG